jgi:hypothetical protein
MHSCDDGWLAGCFVRNPHTLLTDAYSFPGESAHDELPLAKLGNFTYAEDVRKRVTGERQAGARAKRNILKRKSISVDAVTGLTTTMSIDIDSFITSDDMGQVLYEDVGAHGYMAPEMIVPPKRDGAASDPHHGQNLYLATSLARAGINFAADDAAISTLQAADTYSFAVLVWESTVVPLGREGDEEEAVDIPEEEEDDDEAAGMAIAPEAEFKPLVTERTARLNPYYKKEPLRAAGFFSRGIRPVFGPEHPPLLRHLIDAAWATDPKLRPPMALVYMYIRDFFNSPAEMIKLYDRDLVGRCVRACVCVRVCVCTPQMFVVRQSGFCSLFAGPSPEPSF